MARVAAAADVARCSDEKVSGFAVRFLPFWHGGTNFHFSCTVVVVVAVVVAATSVAFHIPLAIKAGINHSHSHSHSRGLAWLETSWKLAETRQLVATCGNLISATKWGVIALNDASFVASATRRRRRRQQRRQLRSR